jgi:hypothetical protein
MGQGRKMTNDRNQSARRFDWPLPFSGTGIASLLLASLLATGCADTENKQMTSRCQSEDRAACATLDDERQVRDEEDYKVEPALGYLNLPAGISLPMPVAAHAKADPSM